MYEYSWYMINAHVAVGFIGFNNGLSPIVHQAIKWVSVGLSAVRSRGNIQKKHWDTYIDENAVVVIVCGDLSHTSQGGDEVSWHLDLNLVYNLSKPGASAMILAKWGPMGQFNIKTPCYHHRDSQYKDEAVVNDNNGNSFTGKKTALYWIGPRLEYDAYRSSFVRWIALRRYTKINIC